MSKLLSLFKRKKEESGPSTSTGDNGLIIYAANSSYVVREQGGEGGIVAQGNVPYRDSAGVDQIEKIIQSAVQQTPDKRLKSATRISIILDSDDTQFVDMRQSSLGAANNERIRDFGTRLTGTRYVSFGRMSFGAGEKSRKGQFGVIGFIDHGALERYLAALGEHCTKLTHLVPCGSLLISRAEGYENKTYAGLLVGGNHSTIVVANHRQNSAVVRYIPAGRDTLVAAVAAKASLSEEQVLNNFGQRDYFRALIEKEANGDDDISIGPIEDAMSPSLRRLSADVIGTIDYFEQQLAADRAESIELLGDSDQLKGFRDWLGAALALEVQRIDSPMAETFRHGDLSRHLNLLSGLEGNPILVGKSRYTMQDRKLVKAAPQPKKQQANKSVSKERGRRRRSDSRPSGEGFLSKIFNKRDDSSGSFEGEVENQAAYFFLFFALIFGVFFWGYQQYTKQEKVFRARALSYQGAVTETRTLKQGLSKLGVKPVVVTPGDATKILWTEKFLSLADQMTNEIWLTDVHLEDGSTTFGDLTLKTKRLAIEGAALPSSEGHIAEIADFIRRLEKDDKRFMSDFRLITFGGSNVDENDRDPVVRFALSAWYDRSKRLEIVKSTNTKKTEVGGLEQTQRNIRKKREAQARALKGLSRSN